MTLRKTTSQSPSSGMGGGGQCIATRKRGEHIIQKVIYFVSSKLSHFIMKTEYLGKLGWAWDLRQASLGSTRKRSNYKHSFYGFWDSRHPWVHRYGKGVVLQHQSWYYLTEDGHFPEKISFFTLPFMICLLGYYWVWMLSLCDNIELDSDWTLSKIVFLWLPPQKEKGIRKFYRVLGLLFLN